MRLANIMEGFLLSPMTQQKGHKKNISVAELKCGWAHDAHRALVAAEQAEADLSYASECKSEGMRKLSGSYYTPADVAEFFWHIFFSRNEINSTRDALRLIDEYAFIEPSVGAGALFFALVKKLLLLGVSPSQLQEMRVDMVDLNQKALDFVS